MTYLIRSYSGDCLIDPQSRWASEFHHWGFAFVAAQRAHIDAMLLDQSGEQILTLVRNDAGDVLLTLGESA